MEISDWPFVSRWRSHAPPQRSECDLRHIGPAEADLQLIPWAPAPLFRALFAPRSYPPCAGLFFVPRSCRQVVIRTKSRKAQRLVEVESWPRKTGQGVKWIFCLTAA